MTLKVTNLAVDHGPLRAVWDVSLHVAPGERVGLLGTNGAGKSTTMGALMGIYAPIDGEIYWDGQKINLNSVRDRIASGIAMVPEGRGLFPAMTVQENLRMGAYAPSTRSNLKASLDRVFALFPILAAKASQLAGQLSGGQQQMVAVGRALISEPRIMLLDEPFSGVAPMVVEDLMKALIEISNDGVAVLLVEQNIHRAFNFVDRAYVVENGRLVTEGSREMLLSDVNFGRKFLGLD